MTLPAALRQSLRIPLIGAPMFIVSGPELVLAQCTSGIVGAFPALKVPIVVTSRSRRACGHPQPVCAGAGDTPVF